MTHLSKYFFFFLMKIENTSAYDQLKTAIESLEKVILFLSLFFSLSKKHLIKQYPHIVIDG